MSLPQDPHILVSVLNARLRDLYSSLDQLCDDLELDKETLVAKLKAADYEYNADINQFV